MALLRAAGERVERAASVAQDKVTRARARAQLNAELRARDADLEDLRAALRREQHERTNEVRKLKADLAASKDALNDAIHDERLKAASHYRKKLDAAENTWGKRRQDTAPQTR